MSGSINMRVMSASAHSSHYYVYSYNFFTGCPEAKTCTIILRGGAEQFIEETERSIHDAIMIVRRAMKNDAVVAGGGAIEVGAGSHSLTSERD